MTSKITPERTFSMQTEHTPAPYNGGGMGDEPPPDTLSPSDAAAICAGGLQCKCYLTARVGRMRDLTSVRELERLLYREALSMSRREKWVNGLGKAPIRGISELAVAEMLDPATFNNEAVRVAWFGQRLRNKNSKRSINQDRIWPLWERCWRQRYSALYDALERWCGVAESHVIHRQRSEMSR
jgi:hypothetical protein